MAILPLALLVLGQELEADAPLVFSLNALDVTKLLVAVAPLALMAIVAIKRTRAWERLHAP